MGARAGDAHGWCDKMGAVVLDELGEGDVFGEMCKSLELKPLEIRRLRKALQANCNHPRFEAQDLDRAASTSSSGAMPGGALRAHDVPQIAYEPWAPDREASVALKQQPSGQYPEVLDETTKGIEQNEKQIIKPVVELAATGPPGQKNKNDEQGEAARQEGLAAKTQSGQPGSS